MGRGGRAVGALRAAERVAAAGAPLSRRKDSPRPAPRRRAALASRLSVTLQRAPLSPLERAAKRALDVALASIALVVLAPTLLALAALIKLDSPGRRSFASGDAASTTGNSSC